MKRVKKWLIEREWAIVLCFAIIAFSLGFVGFTRMLSDQNAVFSPTLVTYWTFQLFLLGASFDPAYMNLYLKIASLLAPALFFYAAVKAGFQILKEQILSAKIGRLKDHVIICGAGEKGYLFAEQYIKDNFKVVVIDVDDRSSLLQQCREIGALTMIGNVSDQRVLSKAGIDHAHSIIAVCGDDGVNTQIWVNINDNESMKRREKPLNCYIHIANVPIYDNLREQELIYSSKPLNAEEEKNRDNAVNHSPENWASLNLFNTNVNGAVKLLSEYPIVNNEQDAPHVMVVGLGNLAESFILQTIKNWHVFQQKEAQKRKLKIYIIDPLATSKKMFWEIRYQSLNVYSTIESIDLDINSAEFHSLFDRLLDASILNNIYVCMEDDVAGVTAALILSDKIRGKDNGRIILCVPHERGLAQMISRVISTCNPIGQIQAFGFLEKACNKDLIKASDVERLAQALHQGYLIYQLTEGKKLMGSSEVMHDWIELPDAHKQENYNQARRIVELLDTQDYAIRQRYNWDEPLVEFSPQEIEAIAKQEHERWRKSKESKGWKLGEVTDGENKINSYLKDWEKLLDDEKKITRETVRNIPRKLAETNFEIFRLRNH